MSARISVVVPTRDRPDQLAECLDSLLPQLRHGDQLIVVDSASRDAARVAAVATARDAEVLRCDVAGASLARNAGAAGAAHDIVAFLDDDVRVGPGWADHLTAAFSDPTVGFVCGRVSVPPHQLDYQRPVAVNEGDTPLLLEASARSGLGPSANLAVRRQLLEAVGGFDEALGAGGRLEAAEDLDLYDRLFAIGARGWFAPDALAWHEQWRDRRALLRLDWGYGVGSGARLAKLVRTDPSRARFVARTVLWDTDVRGLLSAVRRREEFSTLTTLVRLFGTVAGAVRGLLTPVRAGMYDTRRRSRPVS